MECHKEHLLLMVRLGEREHLILNELINTRDSPAPLSCPFEGCWLANTLIAVSNSTLNHILCDLSERQRQTDSVELL